MTHTFKKWRAYYGPDSFQEVNSLPDLLTMIKVQQWRLSGRNPTTYLYGTVISINPLEIQVDEDMKLVLSEDFFTINKCSKRLYGEYGRCGKWNNT